MSNAPMPAAFIGHGSPMNALTSYGLDTPGTGAAEGVTDPRPAAALPDPNVIAPEDANI